MRRALPVSERAAAALSFLLRFAFMLAFIGAGVCAVLAWFEPCATSVSLCSAVPLIRQPYAGRGPRWWQRLMLRARLVRLRARHRTMLHDVEFLQREVALTRSLLDHCQADAEEAADQIAWARSDLAKLEMR